MVLVLLRLVGGSDRRSSEDMGLLRKDCEGGVPSMGAWHMRMANAVVPLAHAKDDGCRTDDAPLRRYQARPYAFLAGTVNVQPDPRHRKVNEVTRAQKQEGLLWHGQRDFRHPLDGTDGR